MCVWGGGGSVLLLLFFFFFNSGEESGGGTKATRENRLFLVTCVLGVACVDYVGVRVGGGGGGDVCAHE